jgi:hypothetical protein
VSPKPLLVGELNPYGADSYFALYPAPPGCAGDRLCRLVLQMEPDEYLARFERVNLCSGRWSAPAARRRADELTCHVNHRYSALVLLGAKVADAFGLAFSPFNAVPSGRGCLAVMLPHPSGRCRLWREPGAYKLARTVLREAGVLA